MPEEQLATESAKRNSPVFGILWLGSAALWNPLTMNWLLGEASLRADVETYVVLALGLLSLVLAVRAFLRPLSSLGVRLNLLLLMTIFVLPILSEFGLRAALAADKFELRDAGLYSDPFCEDDFWKLNNLWREDWKISIDPELGWAPYVSTPNPLGIIRPWNYTPQRENVVLCFGDSFMAHAPVAYPRKIPDQLEEKLVDRPVYNYGMGGYGFGQIYLRFQQATPKFVEPIVVVGLMLSDMDRTVLSVRTAPKPHFFMRDGELAMEGPPFSNDLKAWEAENPPRLKSYLASACIRFRRVQEAEGRLSWMQEGREEKRVVNRAIVENLIEEARASNLRLMFVTFLSPQQLDLEDWRESFLNDLLDELEVPWIDGRKVIEEGAKELGERPRKLYRSDNHPNRRGNKCFADAIAARMNELWGVEIH